MTVSKEFRKRCMFSCKVLTATSDTPMAALVIAFPNPRRTSGDEIAVSSAEKMRIESDLSFILSPLTYGM
jgi:hypothetical protein